MMKLFKVLLVLIIIFGAVGYGIFHFGSNIASEKIVDGLASKLENSGQLEEVKELVKNDPDIKNYIGENAVSNPDNLPFTTKEQATRVIIQKVGISKIQDIQTKYQNGMTNNDIQEILKDMEDKLSEEEIVALKLVAYKELNK